MTAAGKAFLVLGLVFTILFCLWAGASFTKSVQFDRQCKAYIKRAADANTVELAKTELAKAIIYAERNNLTEGIVYVFLKNPRNDIGFWYENMKAAYHELDELPEDSTPMEKTNVLMKLRESLTDQEGVTCPEGISIYPHNVMYFWWFILSLIGAIIFWFLFYVIEYV